MNKDHLKGLRCYVAHIISMALSLSSWALAYLGDGVLLLFAIIHQQRNNKVPEGIALIWKE
jgi:hypothetical protein